MKRREFPKASLTISTLTGANGLDAPAAEPRGRREFYELQEFHFNEGAPHQLLHAYPTHAETVSRGYNCFLASTPCSWI